MGCSFEAIDAVDDDCGRARAFDPCSHLVQAACNVGNLGLAGRVLQDGLAFRQRGRHHDVMRCADRDLREFHDPALQSFRGSRNDITAVEIDFDAERLERRKVQIDGPCADGASARQRHARLMAARQNRAKHPEARAHAADHVVGRGRVHDIARRQMQSVALMGVAVGALPVHSGIDAVIAQDANEKAYIGEVRHVLQRDRVGGEKACDHQRQSRILRPADRDRAIQAMSARNSNSVHDARWNECVGARPQEKPRSQSS